MSKSSTTTSTNKNNTPYTMAPNPMMPNTPKYTFMGKDVGADNKNSFDDYVNAMYNPIEKNLTNTYKNQIGGSASSANSMGTLDSLGFQNYRTNQLDKNYASAKSDAYNQSQLSAQDYLNNIMTQDFQNQFNNAGMYNNYIANAYDNQNNYNLGNATSSYTAPRQKIFGIF